MLPAGTAHIVGAADQLPVWGTRRRPWRVCDPRITGDAELGERWLDSVVVIEPVRSMR